MLNSTLNDEGPIGIDIGIGIGIGEISASAPTAGVGDFKQFSGGQELSARMGLVPGQNPSGGKTVLGESPSGASHENRQPRQPDIDLAAATRGPRGVAEGVCRSAA